MLLGSLIYNDSVNGAVKFNVTALPLANSILLNVSQSSTDVSEFYKANNVFHRSEERPEYEDCGVGSVRVDIAKSIKTNAVNLEFASRLGTTIKYALSMPTNNSIVKIEKPLYQQFIADYKIGTASFYVTHHNGIVDGVKIKTDYLELSLETGDSDFIFSPLKAKDKYGNKLYSTPISIIAVKLTKENLGFIPPKKKSTADIPTFGMYQTIEEVIAAHPDKNTDWILDRKYQIANKDNFESIVKEFQDWDGMIAFDTETTGLNITFKSAQGEGDTLTGVVLSKEKGTGVYFPLGHTQFENLCNGDIDYFMQTYMKPILENKQIICHNTAFDWKVAYLYGINTNVVFDTMIAFLCTYRYVYGKKYEAGLKALAKNILGLDMFELEDFTIGDWGDGVNFSMLPYELVRRYAPADGDMTFSLYDWIKDNQLLEQYNAVRVHDLEVEFAKAVAYSEYWGYTVDMANLPKMIEDTLAAKEKHMNNMFKLAGHDFNPNSPQQLKKIMYEELGIEKIGGQDSTKAEILKELSKMEDVNGNKLYPFVSELLSYRSHEGTVKNFINHKDDFLTQDGFIFPHIFAFGTDTGRVSIKEPNYQSYDKLVKHYIVPRDGFYMFDCDFSQIEYRVLASMAGQENLCKALEDPDMDYHTYQASRMFNVPYASVTSDLRKQSKGINFGLPYGMEDRSLGKRIFGQATPENTAKAADLRKKYFQGQEKILNFFEVVRSQGVSRNYTETWLGRRRYYNKNQFSVSSIRRQAGNQVIQGSAADIFKMAVVSLFNRICKEGWLGKVLFNAFIHDEMLCEVHSSISPYKFLKAWREEYQVKIKGFCPLYAGCGFGKNWYEAKSQDLPPQFIQECIDRADEPWNENTSEFLKKCNDNFFDYKVRRVKDFITDKNNDGQVIKPLVNALLLETMQDKTGVKEKEIIAKYPKLSDRIVRYKEIFNIQDESYNILPPEDASSSASQTKVVDSSVVIPEMTSIDLIVNSVKNYGVGVDINDMKLYLRFEPSKQSLMNFIRGICSDTNNGGYRLMFVVFDKSYKIMSTPYYITCMDAMQLQQLYAKL